MCNGRRHGCLCQTVQKESDLIILHAGTNDPRSDKTADNIASDIMKLALELKSEKNEIMISSIVFRDDSPELNDKLMTRVMLQT